MASSSSTTAAATAPPSLPCSFVLRMMQWGLDPYDADDSALADPIDSAEDETVVGGHGPLQAWVALSSSYTRSLVVAALRRRAHVWTFIANNEFDAPTVAVAAAAGVAVPAASSSSSSDASSRAWPVNLQFCEFERIDWGAGISSSKAPFLVSSFPVRKGLIRKAQLSFLIQKYTSKRPLSILHETWPETHIMSIDDPSYLEEALNDVYEMRDMIEGQDMWIMKASMVNQALGVHVIRSVRDVEAIVIDEKYEEIREWVVQRYLDRPMLVDGGCKFHVRVYVLAVGNLRVWMWDQMLALIAVEKYQRDEPNRAAHITNTCANASHPDFDEERKVRLLSEIIPDPTVLAPLVDQMRATVHDLFAALHSEPTVFLAVPTGFELYGFDFLIAPSKRDATRMTAYFLEANAGPDFAMTGTRLHPIVNGMMEQTFRIAIDPAMDAAYRAAGGKEDAMNSSAAAASSPATAASSSSSAAADAMTGSFIPCYEVVNNATLSMNFY